MAQSQKGTPSPSDPKEKKSLFDEDIGKEFLSSWKSMSVAKDDAIDFSFDTVSTGKKKKFGFDKLDMDFNLDGDFEKFSSFKADLPDLDFSTLSKKAAKPKEKAGGETSSGNHQGKQDGFTFSFDFDELDSLKFDSNLIEGEKISAKNLDSKGVGSDGIENQGSKCNLGGGSGSLDGDQIEKLPTSDRVLTPMVEAFESDVGSKSSLNDKLPSSSGKSGDLVVSCGARTLPDKTVNDGAEEADQQSSLSMKELSTETYAMQSTWTLPAHSLGGNDSTENVSDLQTETGSQAAAVNIGSGAEQNVDDQLVTTIESNVGNSEPKECSPLRVTESEKNRGESGKTDSEIRTGNMTETEPVLDDLGLEATSAATLSQRASHTCRANSDIQNSASGSLAPLRSEPVIEKLEPTKEKQSGVVCSKFFRSAEEIKSQVRQSSLTRGEVSSLGGKGIAAMHLVHSDDGKREDLNGTKALVGRKLDADSKSLSRKLTKGQPALLGGEKSVKNLRSVREGVTGASVQNGCRLDVNPRPPVKKVTEGDPIVIASKMNTKELNKFGCEVNPASSTANTTKSNAKTSVTSSSMGSIQNSKIVSIEGLKAGKRTPDLSCLNISRHLGASNGQSNATLQRESHSLSHMEKGIEIQGNIASKPVQPVGNAERKTQIITSFKRKAFEESNADQIPLNPHKRLSPLPSESSSKKPQESIAEEQVYNHDIQAERAKNVHCGHLNSGLEIDQEVNLKELEIPVVMDSDGNVEKAEAYARELEDICSMLKKKHEEAKEILVRAIVNNNSLLMLNHPIFDEKIRMVERFAAHLTRN